MGHALERGNGQRGTCTGDANDVRQLMAPVLHRHRAHDHADARGSEIQCSVLDDIRELGDQDRVAAEPEIVQRERIAIDELGDFAERQALRRAADECLPVRGIDESDSVRLRCDATVEQVGDSRIAPPLACAVFTAKTIRARFHGSPHP
jgi:hypothetical protein